MCVGSTPLTNNLLLVPYLTFFCTVNRVSHIFASLNVADVESTVRQGSDVHVLVRAELLPSQVRSNKTLKSRACGYGENGLGMGSTCSILFNVSVQMPLVLETVVKPYKTRQGAA